MISPLLVTTTQFEKDTDKTQAQFDGSTRPRQTGMSSTMKAPTMTDSSGLVCV